MRIRIIDGIDELEATKVLFQNHFGAYRKETTKTQKPKNKRDLNQYEYRSSVIMQNPNVFWIWHLFFLSLTNDIFE